MTSDLPTRLPAHTTMNREGSSSISFWYGYGLKSRNPEQNFVGLDAISRRARRSRSSSMSGAFDDDCFSSPRCILLTRHRALVVVVLLDRRLHHRWGLDSIAFRSRRCHNIGTLTLYLLLITRGLVAAPKSVLDHLRNVPLHPALP